MLDIKIKKLNKNVELLGRTDIDVNELIRLRNEGLTLRAIAAKCGASFCAVRKRLLSAGVKLERLKQGK